MDFLYFTVLDPGGGRHGYKTRLVLYSAQQFSRFGKSFYTGIVIKIYISLGRLAVMAGSTTVGHDVSDASGVGRIQSGIARIDKADQWMKGFKSVVVAGVCEQSQGGNNGEQEKSFHGQLS